MTFRRLLDLLQNADRRALYLLLAVVVSIPLLVSAPAGKAIVLPETRSYYNTIEAIARDPVENKKLIIVSVNFSASTITENLNQLTPTLRQIMGHHLRFALFSFSDPQGRELGQKAAEALAPEFGYVYGRDYVNWGYKAGDPAPNIKALVTDIPGAIGKDIRGTNLADVPVMRGVRTVDDVSLVAEFASALTLENWMAYFRSAGRKPVAVLFAPTAVMAPEAFPFLKSGQLQGMLNGLKGAGEYETLVGKEAFATRASASLSYAHFLILGLIILGNIGMALARRDAAIRARGAR